MPIVDAVVQYPIKQRRPFVRIAPRIFLHQFQHGILHNVERFIRITRGDLGDAIGAALDLSQKSIELPGCVCIIRHQRVPRSP